jgi:hypothetical protein
MNPNRKLVKKAFITKEPDNISQFIDTSFFLKDSKQKFNGGYCLLGNAADFYA